MRRIFTVTLSAAEVEKVQLQLKESRMLTPGLVVTAEDIVQAHVVASLAECTMIYGRAA